MNKTYIWTHHASKRLGERKIPRKYIEQLLETPDQIVRSVKHGHEYQKKIAGKTVAAVIKQKSRSEYLIISCWINPPFPGTKDHKLRARYVAMQHATPVKKLWLKFLSKVGI